MAGAPKLHPPRLLIAGTLISGPRCHRDCGLKLALCCAIQWQVAREGIAVIHVSQTKGVNTQGFTWPHKKADCRLETPMAEQMISYN